jgi:hypothetical protein
LIEHTEVLPKLKRNRRFLTGEERRLKLKREAAQKQTQIQISRSTQRALLADKVLRRCSALESKFRRFEIRCQLDAVQDINRGWISLIAAVGAMHDLTRTAINYKVTPR